MKLSDIFRKKGEIVKTKESIVKIDKKQLAKLTGGVDGTTITGVVTDNKHPEGIYVTDNKHPEGTYR